MITERANFNWLIFSSAILFIMLAQCVTTAEGAGVKGDTAGLALARKVYNRKDGKDMSSQVLMVLKEKGRKSRTRLLYSFAKDKGKAERWTLMRFVKPADIADTGLLTKDYPGDESNQWLYLPALGRVRVISASRKGGRFVGSDFLYEDLRDREVEMDRHRLYGKGKVGKIACDVLISTPVDTSNSVYSKRISWIHPKSLIPLRIDYYKKGIKKPVKRLMARKLKRIQGYWTVLDSTMYDLKSGHKTQLVTKKIRYDQGLPDVLFTKQGLSDVSREKRFRP